MVDNNMVDNNMVDNNMVDNNIWKHSQRYDFVYYLGCVALKCIEKWICSIMVKL